MATKSGRTISAEKKSSWKQTLLKWETFLIILFIAVNVMNSFISPNYLSVSGLFTATSSFLEKHSLLCQWLISWYWVKSTSQLVLL